MCECVTVSVCGKALSKLSKQLLSEALQWGHLAAFINTHRVGLVLRDHYRRPLAYIAALPVM